MNDFTTWFKELKASNPIWWDALPLAYPKKDYVQLAKECYVHLLSNCQTIMKNKDWERMRNTYQKFLLYGKEKTDVEKMPEVEPVVIHPKAIPKDDPRYMEYTNKWLEIIANTPKWQRPAPVLDEEVEGAERLKPHGTLYSSTTPEQVKAKERHLAYVKYCYDPITAEPNENWVEEKEFNLLYDQGLI